MGSTAITLSGIDLVDTQWGGLYQGSSYLVTASSTREARLLTLRFLKTGVDQEKTGLFISSGRPEALTTDAHSVGLNIREAHAAGLLKLLRFPPPASLHALDDAGLARTLLDLATVIRRHQPHRVVIDDLLPFVQFRMIQHLRPAFMQMLAQLDSLDLTLLFTLPEPDGLTMRRMSTFVAEQMAGELKIEQTEDDAYHIVLHPRLSHTQHASALLNVAALRLPKPVLESATFAPLFDFEERLSDASTWPLDEIAFVSSPKDASLSHTDREAFSLRLQQRYHQYALNGTPFLLIALRIDNQGTPAPDFHLLSACVRALLAPADDYLEHLHRMVVVLDQSTEADTQRFFARLKKRLQETVPDQAALYLQKCTAIVVPTKRFLTAEEFLTFAFDENDA